MSLCEILKSLILTSTANPTFELFRLGNFPYFFKEIFIFKNGRFVVPQVLTFVLCLR